MPVVLWSRTRRESAPNAPARTVETALRARVPDATITDVFEDTVVYQQGGKSYQMRYAWPLQGAVCIKGDPVEVRAVYVPVARVTSPRAPLPAVAVSLGRRASTVVHARVSLGTARALRSHARMLRTTPGAILRGMVERAANPKDRKRLTDLLGLPVDATDAQVTAAVTDLIAATSSEAGAPPPEAGATAGNADASPPASAFRRELTKDERAYCQRHKITPAEFVARTRAAVRTQPKKAR